MVKICLNCDEPYFRSNYDHKSKYCSDKCKHDYRKRTKGEYIKKHDRERSRKKMKHFHKWKLSIGCQLCGYNECGASLVLHHLYNKKFRIKKDKFWNLTEERKKELEKCVILCSNCHKSLHFYEIHDKNKFDNIMKILVRKTIKID